MAIKTGRYGRILWDPTGAGSPSGSPLISMDSWKLSLKTPKNKVTCFDDENEVYVPGLKDISGSASGFWNSDNVALFDAADAEIPGYMELIPNSTEPTFYWKGPAYMDADIDCSVQGSPKVSGSFVAAGSWTRFP